MAVSRRAARTRKAEVLSFRCVHQGGDGRFQVSLPVGVKNNTCLFLPVSGLQSS